MTTTEIAKKLRVQASSRINEEQAVLLLAAERLDSHATLVWAVQSARVALINSGSGQWRQTALTDIEAALALAERGEK